MIQSQIKALLMHRTLGIMLAYWNCYAYVLIVVVFTLVGRLLPGSDLLVCLYSWWLVVAGHYFYYCLFDYQQWLCSKVEGVAYLPLGWSTGRDGQLLQAKYKATCESYI